MIIKRRGPIIKTKPNNMEEWLCYMRGVKEDVESFFSPSSKFFIDPFELDNMDEAVEKYHEAILNSSRIYFYSDV